MKHNQLLDLAKAWCLVLLLVSCVPVTAAPTPTLAPLATATVAPTQTPKLVLAPTVTLTPPPTSTPTPALKQLTSGGCCVQPSWSADSRRVLFIDKPSPSDPSGLYAVDVAASVAGTAGAANPPQKVGPVAFYSRDFSLITYLDKQKTMVEKVGTGEKWAVPNNGRSIAFSPDNQHISWEDSDDYSNTPYDQRLSDLYIAKIDGTGVERVAQVYGGGFAGWLPDGKRILVSARPSLAVHERTLSVFDLAAKSFTKLVTVERISGVTLSKDGTWIAYYITFETDQVRNGLWVQRTDGSPARKIELWGAYQWRDDGRLLVIPARASADRAFDVLEVEAATGKIRKLTDAAVTPLQILNGDWRVSPDGHYVVYVSSTDRNLWVLALPGGGEAR